MAITASVANWSKRACRRGVDYTMSNLPPNNLPEPPPVAFSVPLLTQLPAQPGFCCLAIQNALARTLQQKK
jgi:hypothetical protein